MKAIKSYILLAAGLIVGSGVWSGCYTQLALDSDNAAPQAEFDTTAVNQITTINEVAQSAFINDPWLVGPFVPYYFPPNFARTPLQKNGAVSAYRPLPLTATPSASSGAESQAPSPHRQSGYQRSSPSDQNGSRATESTPPRSSQSPAPATPPDTPRDGTPAPNAPGTVAPAPSAPRAVTPAPIPPPTGTPAASPPPANNRAGGATRSGR